MWGSASQRVAQQLHTRLAKEVEAHGIAKRGDAWLKRLNATILGALAEGGPATTAELREQIPPLARRMEMAPGKSYGGNIPIAPRVLGTLGAHRPDPPGQQRGRLARSCARGGPSPRSGSARR